MRERAGYPLSDDPDFDQTTTPAGVLHHSFDRVRSVAEGFVHYYAWTDEGMSGGPVWTYDRDVDRRNLVGVQIGQSYDGTSVGVLVTAPMRRFLGEHGAPIA